MQRSGCLKVTLDTYDEHETNPGYTLQIPSWCQAVRKNLSTSFTALTRTSADSMCLPLQKIPKESKVSTASQQTGPIPERERYLLICMHRTQHHVNVNQESLQDVTTDRKLFCFLKKTAQNTSRAFPQPDIHETRPKNLFREGKFLKKQILNLGS
jgi:hypothetical protein